MPAKTGRDADDGFISKDTTRSIVGSHIACDLYAVRSEAPRQNHFTARLRPLGEDWTEFSLVRVAYAGSSEPARLRVSSGLAFTRRLSRGLFLAISK